ncbi:hypothetical protein [Burkholderia sp. LMU1-1-1.1]|jgi:hypothetical protein|uniref:hypothetical protein n=1 Tax=Burkholderia sp. LMU1-1-1.1 TaxID=3135266 RepID=UPI00342804CD
MDKIASWIVWLIILAGNGFIGFLWLVFGLAAAGSSAGVPSFLWMTGVGTGIPLLASLYFMAKARFAIGLTLNFLMLPIMFGVLFFLTAFLRD